MPGRIAGICPLWNYSRGFWRRAGGSTPNTNPRELKHCVVAQKTSNISRGNACVLQEIEVAGANGGIRLFTGTS